jgi:hypothetical protein
LKLAADSELVDKKNEKTAKTFLQILIDKKLVLPLESQVARINGGRTPRFADARGYPKRSGVDTLDRHSFPFKFTFTYETLFQIVRGLGHYSPATEQIYTKKITYFHDKFKFIIFVPVNNSAQANKVAPEIHKSWDFANPINDATSLLYFRPLPYELDMQTYEKKVLVYIN